MGETSEHEFRRAMRSLCSGVSIISAGYKGKQFGMTATAVTSVSMTPPSLLVCINKSARIQIHCWAAGGFASTCCMRSIGISPVRSATRP